MVEVGPDIPRGVPGRFALRGVASVVDPTATGYGLARTGFRGVAAGMFDATAGGIYGFARIAFRGVATVVSTAPVYCVGRIGARGVISVQAGFIEIPPPPPLPEAIYRSAGQVVQGGSVEGDALCGGSIAGQIVIAGSAEGHA